jgi:hypothetical protein
LDTGSGNFAYEAMRDPGTLWPKVYAPLVWIASHAWGETLVSFWNLFPVSNTFATAEPEASGEKS